MRLIDADALYKAYQLICMDVSCNRCPFCDLEHGCRVENIIKDAPTLETINGYRLEHLALIAAVMAKEGVTAEMAVEIFNDTGRIVKMVVDEMQEQLKGVVQNCFQDTFCQNCGAKMEAEK